MLERPQWLEYVGEKLETSWDNYRNVASWAKTGLAIYATATNQTFHEAELRGSINKKNYKKLNELLKSYGETMTLGRTNHVEETLDNVKKGSERTWTYWTKNTLFTFILTPEDESWLCVYSLSRAHANKIKKSFVDFFGKKSDQDGRVFLLEKQCDGIAVVALGKGGAPFLDENYEESAAKKFHYIQSELASPEPRGRLFILDGPPGTGKSFFVRGLIENVKNVVFLLIPSSQIASLSDISFMPVVRKLAEDEQAPIVLILEDADNALLPRDTHSNMSIISDLLNFTDGILGSIIDFRIIATTNAKNIEIEPALKRKRRLGCSVNIEKLSVTKATEVYKRLVDGDKFDASQVSALGRMTLAEVYALADEATVPIDEGSSRKVGF